MKCTRLYLRVRKFGYLAIAVYYNLVRDFVWSLWSIYRFDSSFMSNTSLRQLVVSQWFYSTLAMFGAMVVHYVAYVTFKPELLAPKHFPWKASLIAIFAASAAIPAWDVFQDFGGRIGRDELGYDEEDAGYFAALLTGLAEGPVQEMVTTTCIVLFDLDGLQASFKQYPKAQIAALMKRLVFAATIGAIPGDLWQVVWNACVVHQIDVLSTSLAVAASVAVCNVIYGLVISAILTPSGASNPTDVDPDELKFTEDGSFLLLMLAGPPAPTTGKPQMMMAVQLQEEERERQTPRSRTSARTPRSSPFTPRNAQTPRNGGGTQVQLSDLLPRGAPDSSAEVEYPALPSASAYVVDVAPESPRSTRSAKHHTVSWDPGLSPRAPLPSEHAARRAVPHDSSSAHSPAQSSDLDALAQRDATHSPPHSPREVRAPPHSPREVGEVHTAAAENTALRDTIDN